MLLISNKRLGVLAIKIGSIPQWTKNGKKIYATMLQVVIFVVLINFESFFMISILKVLDNHVVDYIPAEIMQKTQKGTIDRTKNGLLGMAIVGALSSDPRLV